VLALMIRPRFGLSALWRVLIASAPALLVFAPGIWRNICPLATSANLLRRRHFKRWRLGPAWQGRFFFFSLVLLLILVPLRHVVLDTNGILTAGLLMGVTIVAAVLGSLFEGKSGWCSGLCPVLPVETLYGSRPGVTVSNMHCDRCERCVGVCPDSTPGMDPLGANLTQWHTVAGMLMAGGFPGFVWGWFQVGDYTGPEGWSHLGRAYGLPIGAMMVTLAIYLVVRLALTAQHRTRLTRVFAASAVACYYWYTIPALVGFGATGARGALVDLSAVLPAGFPMVSHAISTALFAWWLVFRPETGRSWCRRPIFARGSSAQPGLAAITMDGRPT